MTTIQTPSTETSTADAEPKVTAALPAEAAQMTAEAHASCEGSAVPSGLI